MNENHSSQRPYALATLAALLALPACGGADQDAPRQVRIRLGDLLEVASIESPLTEIPAASGLEQLEDVPVQQVFAEDFEDFDPAAAEWPVSSLEAIIESEGGHAYCMADGDAQRRSWTIEAEPNTHYVFERSVQTSSALVADFEIVEVDEPLTIAELVARREGVSRTHWAPAPEPDGSWQHGSVSFFTRAYTKALIIVLWVTPRRVSQLTTSERESYRACYDNIRLSRLDPTPTQSIALGKAANLARDADPALGMRKRGQFPPLLTRAGNEDLTEDNYTFRYALYTPPPTELGFPLEIGPDAALRFSCCLSAETRRGHACRFEVLMRSGGEEEVLWSKTLRAEPRQWHWHDERVDLAAQAGKSGTLVLRTSAVQGDPHPMWGNPVLEGPARGAGPRLVVLIAVDTLRADRLSCYGYERETTPHIDALAADGVRFDHVVSNATWTCPSFASIFTGVVPSRHSVWVAGSMWAQLPERFETLAERFRSAGWATHAIAYKSPIYRSGYDQGFDVSFNVPSRIGLADNNLAKALDWLNASGDLRSFLFLHFDDPHEPYNQPSPFDEAFSPASYEGPAPSRVTEQPIDEPDRRPAQRAQFLDRYRTTSSQYDGEVAYVDDRIGAFLDELKARGLYDDALVVFVSDHGEALWEHGTFGHSLGKLYDEGVRVPLIVKPAGAEFARGRVVPTQVRAFDVMPTLLELAGIAVTPEIDAQSLAPLLTADGPDRLAVTETFDGGLAVRTRRWKFISKSWRDPKSTELLFDLQADPGELRDVAELHADVASEMRVRAFDYVMLNRPGRYLVAIGDGSQASYEYTIHGVEKVTAIHGRGGRPLEDGAFRFAGDSPHLLLLLAQLSVAGPVSVGESAPVPLDSRRYAAGDLERLLSPPASTGSPISTGGTGSAGLYLFEGPEPAQDEPDPRQALDPEQLEALRALGYLGK